MTEILSTATGAASSADFTVATGKKYAVFLKNDGTAPIGSKALVYLEIKAGSDYFPVGTLDVSNPAQFLEGGVGTITYRARRSADSDVCGVEGI